MVEVIAPTGRESARLGSGYQISPSLVLTARHVVAGLAGQVDVRYGHGGDPQRYPARVVWTAQASDLDVAVLQLTQPRDCAAVRFGVAPAGATQRYPYRSMGYPRFQTRTLASGAVVRDGHELMGFISPLTNPKTGLFELDRDTRVNTVGESWEGFSGAAVFSHDLLVGVVTRAAHTAGVLVAVPLRHLIPGAMRARPEFTERQDRLDELHALLTADHVDTQPELMRRRPTYLDRVADWFSAPADERSTELHRLGSFAQSGTRSQWWMTPPWYGKTTLAAHFFLHPPTDVDLVAFFFSRRLSQQAREFQQTVADQLAAICGETAPTGPDLDDLTELWTRAESHSAANNRTLVLLLDGLDEAHDQRRIADLIPVRARLIVLSRPGVEVPSLLPPEHPLAVADYVLEMTQSLHASELEQRAIQELDDLLVRNPDQPTETVLGLCAAAEGPLRLSDVDELAGKHLPRGEALSLTRIKNVMRVRAPRILQLTSDGYVFAHDQLRAAAAETLGMAATRRSRQAIHSWAEHYADLGWPESTPGYLCEHYTALLTTVNDTARLVRLPSRPRTALLRSRAGHDTAALREIDDALTAAVSAEDIVSTLVLAIHRDELLTPVGHLPQEIAVAWGAVHQWGRAAYLAANLTAPPYRAWALRELAAVAEDLGESDRAAGFLAAAAAIASEPWESNDYDVELAGGLHEALAAGDVSGACDLLSVAVAEAPDYDPEPDQLSRSLIYKIDAAARTLNPALISQAEQHIPDIPLYYMQGVAYALLARAIAFHDLDDARRLVKNAELVSTTDHLTAEHIRLLSVVAEADARAGDTDGVKVILDSVGDRVGAAEILHTVQTAAKGYPLEIAERLAGLSDESVGMLLTLADLAHSSGDAARALRYVDAARQKESDTRRLQTPNYWSGHISWHSISQIAQLYARLGHVERAIAILGEIEDPDQLDDAVVEIVRILAAYDPARGAIANDLLGLVTGVRHQVDAHIEVAKAASRIGDQARVWAVLDRAAELSNPQNEHYGLITVAATAAALGTTDAFDFADRIIADYPDPYVRADAMTEIAASEARSGFVERAATSLSAALAVAAEVDHEPSRRALHTAVVRAAGALPTSRRGPYFASLAGTVERSDLHDAIGQLLESTEKPAELAKEVLAHIRRPSTSLRTHLAIAVADDPASFEQLYSSLRGRLDEEIHVDLLVRSALAATSQARATTLLDVAWQQTAAITESWPRHHARLQVMAAATKTSPETARPLIVVELAKSFDWRIADLAMRLDKRAAQAATAWLRDRDIRYPKPASFD
ncbi:trypsin-like peptidase domain-containing protein [Pseudonocardia sp. GCM10023141]|uniref:trypsin-like peptidase domain-containing protein n=1 Tax=Pseudonocardia sp. GCM10023141 TaxID=3252653 RepID=UPI00360B0B3C